MIRPAKFADVPRIAELLEEAYGGSIYADRAAFDVKTAKALLVQALHRHGHKTAGGSLVMVGEKGGVVEGFIVGAVERVYHVLDRFMATDMWFVCSKRADPRDASRMLKAFVEWAESNPKVIEIRMGITNAMGDGWRKAGKLYERAGFVEAGGMYERRVR